MTPGFPEADEFRGLLDALCEESITPGQLRRLEELILARPEAEAYYVRYMSFYADLARTFTGRPAGAARTGPAPAAVVPAPVGSGGGMRRGSRRKRLLLWAGIGLAGLAAGLLIGVGFWPPRPQDKTQTAAAEPVDDTVAVLLQTHRAEWDETGMPTRPGAPLRPGTLVLKSGHAQIEFYSGATVILEGPAEFQLVSRSRAYCGRGKLRATVPPQAEGFEVGSPTLDLIDRGTEFGMEVGGQKTDVHVFQGKVDVYPPAAGPGEPPRKELTTGQGVSVAGTGAAAPIAPNPAGFLTAGELADRAAEETLRRQREWAAASAAARRDPTLLVYYPFEAADPLRTRTLRDEAGGRREPRDGAVVGCSWGTGRWAGKQGLEFKRTSDRVRLHVPGEFESVTLAAWVRPDALPNLNNSLLMADGWEEGEPHWQIGSDGTVILGVRGPPGYNPAPNVRGPQYRAYGVVTPERFGRWVHLAVVYDRDANEVVHYVDGRPVAREEIQLDLTLRIGDAEIGNWNAAAFRTKSPVRNFNGCIDEFMLFSRPLAGDEVERLYAQGRPPS